MDGNKCRQTHNDFPDHFRALRLDVGRPRSGRGVKEEQSPYITVKSGRLLKDFRESSSC